MAIAKLRLIEMLSNLSHGYGEAYTLFESENIKVICRDHASETVFVTWNEGGLVINGLSFWADQLLDRNEIAAIGVMTPRINYYPKAETLAAVPYILEAARGRRIVNYGFSHGGHGALKYSAALNADLVVGFSPRWSINAKDRGDYVIPQCKYFESGLENGTAIQAEEIAGRSYIFYDPHERADRFDAEMILATGKVQPVIMPFSRHATVRLVAETGLATDFLQICMCGQENAKDFRHLIRTGRSRSDTYHVGRIASLLRRSRPERARKCLTPLVPEFYKLQVQVHCTAAAGHTQDIVRIVESAPDEAFQFIAGDSHDDFMKLWKSLYELQIPDAEILLARKIISIRQSDLWGRLHAVITFKKYGMVETARHELTNAVAVLGKQVHDEVIARLATELQLDL